MKKIPLSRGLFAFVNDSDFERISKFKWYASRAWNTWYALRRRLPSERLDGRKSPIKMHREILCQTDPIQKVDHKDHNGLNNQRENLRLANAKQNTVNRTSKKGATSRFLGVDWKKSHGLWRTRIESTSLGYFKDERLAALAYDKEASIRYGEFANLNFK